MLWDFALLRDLLKANELRLDVYRKGYGAWKPIVGDHLSRAK